MIDAHQMIVATPYMQKIAWVLWVIAVVIWLHIAIHIWYTRRKRQKLRDEWFYN